MRPHLFVFKLDQVMKPLPFFKKLVSVVFLATATTSAIASTSPAFSITGEVKNRNGDIVMTFSSSTLNKTPLVIEQPNLAGHAVNPQAEIIRLELTPIVSTEDAPLVVVKLLEKQQQDLYPINETAKLAMPAAVLSRFSRLIEVSQGESQIKLGSCVDRPEQKLPCDYTIVLTVEPR